MSTNQTTLRAEDGEARDPRATWIDPQGNTTDTDHGTIIDATTVNEDGVAGGLQVLAIPSGPQYATLRQRLGLDT